MKVLKSNELEVNSDDDFLYERLLKLLDQLKLVQGGSSLPATLRRHNRIKVYLMAKQIEKLRHIEETYFNDDGSLSSLAIQNYHIKNRSLQSNNNVVN